MNKSKCFKRQTIVRQYQEAGEPWPASFLAIAVWAIRNGLWKVTTAAAVDRCRGELIEAMRKPPAHPRRPAKEIHGER